MFLGIQSGQPVNNGNTMARSTMLSILGRMATHSGQRITWDEAFASHRVLAPQRYAWDADPPVLPGPDGAYRCPFPA
jgi:hypothetical protein